MPWEWSGTGEKSVALGGSRGTPEEAAQGKAWPKYEIEYLRHRLDNPAGKYLVDEETERAVKQHILLERAAEDYKQEADECLQAEFKQWLAGVHPENRNPQPYMNGDGKAVRRYTYRNDLLNAPPGKQIGDPMEPDLVGGSEPWVPTWWGTDQLTHLPGVREYLRSTEHKRSDADAYMNLLAEHGPQDLKSAWMYFKHWVKGRPVGPETCPTDEIEDLRDNEGRVPVTTGYFVSRRGERVDGSEGWVQKPQYKTRYREDPSTREDFTRSDYGRNPPADFLTKLRRQPQEVGSVDVAEELLEAVENAPVNAQTFRGRMSSLIAETPGLAKIQAALSPTEPQRQRTELVAAPAAEPPVQDLFSAESESPIPPPPPLREQEETDFVAAQAMSLNPGPLTGLINQASSLADILMSPLRRPAEEIEEQGMSGFVTARAPPPERAPPPPRLPEASPPPPPPPKRGRRSSGGSGRRR